MIDGFTEGWSLEINEGKPGGTNTGSNEGGEDGKKIYIVDVNELGLNESFALGNIDGTEHGSDVWIVLGGKEGWVDGNIVRCTEWILDGWAKDKN